MQDTVELSAPSLSHVSVGVIVRNEEKNIVNLLRSISEQKLKNLVVDEVIVVSSSKDKTDELVQRYSEKDNRVRLVLQNGGKGKASAINEFLKASRNEIVVVSSGDVIFNNETLQNLVFPITQDKRVGMSSVRPIPINDASSFMGAVASIHWRLHNLLERHGETTAFRKSLVKNIPEGMSADEAYVESAVRQKCFKTAQADNSLIFNKGSEDVLEFLNQIRRHYVGHLFIKTSFSYVVSSMTIKGLTKVAKELLRCVGESPDKVGYVIGYVFLEAIGRLLGIWDFYVKGRTYRVWNSAQTTKNLNNRDTIRSAE